MPLEKSLHKKTIMSLPEEAKQSVMEDEQMVGRDSCGGRVAAVSFGLEGLGFELPSGQQVEARNRERERERCHACMRPVLCVLLAQSMLAQAILCSDLGWEPVAPSLLSALGRSVARTPLSRCCSSHVASMALLRSGYRVLLPELSGESPENHLQKPNCPKETGHSPEFLDALLLLGRSTSH